MIVRPMIGEWEPQAIESIELLGSRRVARLSVPGLMGDLHQDLGTDSMTVVLTGSLQGDDRRSQHLEKLQEHFLAGDPVTFVADITESSDIEEVIVVAFDVAERSEWGDEFSYRIVLRQYVEPPEPPGLLDLGVELPPNLDDLALGLLEGFELPGLLGAVPAVVDPTVPLQPALDQVRAATAAVPALLTDLRTALEVDA